MTAALQHSITFLRGTRATTGSEADMFQRDPLKQKRVEVLFGEPFHP
jgi:hypothetical protein